MKNSQELLRASGLRLTAPRLAVLEALAALGPHQSADAIASAARARLGTLSTQAVYDNLRVLVEAGIVRRFEPAGSAALYEMHVGDDHRHLVCRSCGRAEDVDCEVGKPSRSWGSAPIEAEVTLWSLCPECQQVLAHLNSSGGDDT